MQPANKLFRAQQQVIHRLLLLNSNLQHLMLQVHVVIHVPLLYPQLLMRVVVPSTLIPDYRPSIQASRTLRPN